MDDTQDLGALEALAPRGPHTLSSLSHLAASQVEVLDGAWCESVQHRVDTPVEREVLMLTPPHATRLTLSEEEVAAAGWSWEQRLWFNSRMATETSHGKEALILGI